MATRAEMHRYIEERSGAKKKPRVKASRIKPRKILRSEPSAVRGRVSRATRDVRG